MDILIVEDNEELGTLIRDFLQKEEYKVTLVNSAEKALNRLEAESFRLVLLDVMLPGMDGFSTCETIRKTSNIPILMMSAKNDEESKLKGYENGADDYVEKPFSIPVLIAKIKALLKRNETEKTEEEISLKGITLNIKARTVKKNDTYISVNAKEFDVLYELMKKPGQVIKKETLFNTVWGMDCFSELTTLNVHIRWLREKLEEDPKNPKLIQTVWRIGYKFGD